MTEAAARTSRALADQWPLLALLTGLTLLAGSISPLHPQGARLDGVVRDSVSRQPIPFAVVGVVGRDVSTLTDRSGRFRLTLDSGAYVLEIRKVGFRMASSHVTVGEEGGALEIYLQPLAVELAALVVTAGDDLATRIIREAIRRKRDLLARIHDYRYHAYVKLAIRDAAKSPDSANAVFLLTETTTSAYWEQPGRYQETIVARRQSRNLDAENNLVSVGEIVNFNRERIDLEKYSVVSPTANDALDHYRYHLLDTLDVDGRRVFRLAIEPRSNTAPLFVGMIDIADSTYDVLLVEVGTNEAIRFDFLRHLRYRQRMRDHGGDRWMPHEIRFTGEVHFGMPIPGIPQRLTFEHVAMLRDFVFDRGEPPSSLDEFIVVVDRAADDADSAEWAGLRPAPLPEVERDAYARIDSLERKPRTLGGYIGLGAGLALLATTQTDFFHFNRVESAYLGAGWTWRDMSPSLVLRTKLGYGFGADRWQYDFGLSYRLHEGRRLWVGGALYDEVVSRPTIPSEGWNPTYFALIARLDPLDYYRERGGSLHARMKLAHLTDVGLRFRDVQQDALGVVTDYSFGGGDREIRPNPPIRAGRLRSLAGSLVYDSRPLIKSKGRDQRVGALRYTRVEVEYELAAPQLISNDFDFQRLGLRIIRRQRSLNLGITSVTAYGGIGWGELPPQRYFTVDFGKGAFFEEGGFNTLDESNYIGDRTAMLVVRHNFDRLAFRKLPVLRHVPFTLLVHGGVFWTAFRVVEPDSVYAGYRTATSAFSEAGFGLANLTPFISPFNFGVYFTWQLSDHGTQRFEFRIGIPGT